MQAHDVKYEHKSGQAFVQPREGVEGGKIKLLDRNVVISKDAGNKNKNTNSRQQQFN